MAKENEAEPRPVTIDDLLKVMNASSQAQRDQFMEAAGVIIKGITQPEPTIEKRQLALAALAQRNEQARQNEATKDYKRKHCCPPAQPSVPHRRTGQSWGMFSGSSVIAWMYTTMTEKTILGSRDSGPVAFGVCQWCGTEFKPGDSDYAEALSWGTSQSIGSYPMNQHTGVWQNA